MTCRLLKRISLAVLLLVGGSALAGGTLSTEFPVYEQGSPILVTFANTGSSQIEATTQPWLGIQNIETEDWVLLPGNLPALTPVAPGEAISQGYDTAGEAWDPAGFYRCVVHYYDDAHPGESQLATCDYELIQPVSDEAETWGAVKSLYR